jgi:hypothetical protein
MTEYIGCKIDRNKNSMKLTQPVLMQSFEDEFDLSNAKSYITPGEPGKNIVLSHVNMKNWLIPLCRQNSIQESENFCT